MRVLGGVANAGITTVERDGRIANHLNVLTALERNAAALLPLLDSALTGGSNVRPDVKGICGDWPGAVLPAAVALIQKGGRNG